MSPVWKDDVLVYNAIACVYDGDVYCPNCCPEPDQCEAEHGAVFPDTESQCSVMTCGECEEEIDTTVIHGSHNPCEWCGVRYNQ